MQVRGIGNSGGYGSRCTTHEGVGSKRKRETTQLHVQRELQDKEPIPLEYETCYEKFNYICGKISQSSKNFPQFKIAIDPESKKIKTIFYKTESY